VAATDYERAWLRLKEHLLEKRSHGTSELVEKMAELEVESAVPEGDEGYDAAPIRHHPQSQTPPAREAAALGRGTAMATH
jgi:hypothetical protein